MPHSAVILSETIEHFRSKSEIKYKYLMKNLKINKNKKLPWQLTGIKCLNCSTKMTKTKTNMNIN